MTQSIRRGDQWWHRRQDGVWLLWSIASQSWEPQGGSPPPPPPPPPLPTATPPAAPVTSVDAPPTAGTAVAVMAPPQTDSAQAHESPPREDSAATHEMPPGVDAVAVAMPLGTDQVAKEETVPYVETPAPDPETASTEPLEVVQTMPAAPVAVGPRPANGEVYSAGSGNILARFESRTLTLVGGALAVVLVFIVTYVGATFAFRPSDDVAPGGPKLSPSRAFILDVDEMCSTASQSAMGLPPPGSPASMAAFAKKSAASQRKLVANLGALTPPGPAKNLFKKMVRKSKAQIDQMKALVAVASAGDDAGTRAAMHRLAASEKRIDAMNRKLGFKECT